MGITLKDFFDYVKAHKAKLVIWRQIAAFLQNEFLSTDATSAKQVLKLDEGEEISEDTVCEIIDVIYMDHIAPAEKRIVTLMDTELDSKLAQLREEKAEERQLPIGEEENPTPIKKKSAVK